MNKVSVFFASSETNVLATNEFDTIIDSGCTNYMLKDRQMFSTLDENFSGSVDSFENEIKGKDRANFMCVMIMEVQQK